MGFSMELPNVAKIAEAVIQETKPQTEEEQALQAQAKANALAIISIDTGSLEQRREMLKPIESFGQATIQRSAQKNQLLEIPLGALSKSGDEGSAVSKSLADLRREVKDLDPSIVNFAKKGRLGKVVNPVRNYFERYQKADVVIGDIISSLNKGGIQLENDNTTLELEQHALRELTKRLTTEIAMGTYMDEELERLIEEAEVKGEDPEKVRFVREEVLFPLRQQLIDMQQMVAVNQQGILAIEVVRRNNRELIRGVDRAKTVTVAALRIAVVVAAALYNQKVVLQKIQALNTTTNEIIAGTSQLLLQQGAEIHKNAAETGVSAETLTHAYNDVIAALDDISRYKLEALPRMKQTVSQFRELASEGEKRIVRLEKGHATGLLDT
jgi:uncharacterized protein YaaN involved in tellurite resistance